MFVERAGERSELAIEATAGARATAGIVEPYVQRVMRPNPKAVRESSRRAETATVDTKVLEPLLAAGFLERRGRATRRRGSGGG